MIDLKVKPRTDREWRATTGMDEKRFQLLTNYFEQTYKELKGADLQTVLASNPNGKNFRFKTYTDLLFFVLFALKTGVTFDILAYVFQLDLANAKRNFNTNIGILYTCLSGLELLPKRSFEEPEEFEVCFSKDRCIIFDGSEQAIQRPVDYQVQKQFYSGKKRTHTIKYLVISDFEKYIHYLSYSYIGKTHDYSVVKQEFPPEKKWFLGYHILLDLGYQGFWKQYPLADAFLPHKKKRNQELTLVQKQENQQLAGLRIKVEHSIGGMKRYDFLSGKCRVHDFQLYDKITAICAGLWNFYITN